MKLYDFRSLWSLFLHEILTEYSCEDSSQPMCKIFLTELDQTEYIDNTVDSRYLEFQGTVWNTSRYPYFDISDLQNWGKTNSINHI